MLPTPYCLLHIACLSTHEHPYPSFLQEYSLNLLITSLCLKKASLSASTPWATHTRTMLFHSHNNTLCSHHSPWQPSWLLTKFKTFALRWNLHLEHNHNSIKKIKKCVTSPPLILPSALFSPQLPSPSASKQSVKSSPITIHYEKFSSHHWYHFFGNEIRGYSPLTKRQQRFLKW